MALQVIDLLLHFGISDLAGFLLEGAVQAGGAPDGRKWNRVCFV